eukprot:gene15145-20398_t
MSSIAPYLDKATCSEWIYPTNYPIRNYQLDICSQAMLYNTLVCLPTGMGKTLIAAVVMYNFYRWYPNGKIVFLAPTKPLVSQQIAACHNIMGIPATETAHLEGSIQADKRASIWANFRVFFCTPQTMLNDIQARRLDPKEVVCLVIDEAHKATSNYAYTSVVALLANESNNFRVLALSATPGADIRKIQNVIENLRIAHIEIRTEDDPDIIQYKHNTQLEIVKCGAGVQQGITGLRKELNELMQISLTRLYSMQITSCNSALCLNFLSIKEAESNLAQLVEDGAIDSNIVGKVHLDIFEVKSLFECRKALNDGGVTALLARMEQFKREYKVAGGAECGMMSAINNFKFTKLLSVLEKAKEDNLYIERQPKIAKLQQVLIQHFERHHRAGSSTRALVFSQLRVTVNEIKAELAGLPGIRAHQFVGQSSRTDGNSGINEKGMTQQEQSHILKSFNDGGYFVLEKAKEDNLYIERQPKIAKLQQVLIQHFERHHRAGSSTRALVFSQLRVTVNEIKAELAGLPGIRAHQFVGQSSRTDGNSGINEKGMTQQEQSHILKSFNDGDYNVLIATSIAEEGLDISEVDLIVLFEAVASPTRLVQRCGRTGRNRSGKVVMLIAEGTEEDKLDKSTVSAETISKSLKTAVKSFRLYRNNPNMLQNHIPIVKYQKMNIPIFNRNEVTGNNNKLSNEQTKENNISNKVLNKNEKSVNTSTISEKKIQDYFISKPALQSSLGISPIDVIPRQTNSNFNYNNINNNNNNNNNNINNNNNNYNNNPDSKLGSMKIQQNNLMHSNNDRWNNNDIWGFEGIFNTNNNQISTSQNSNNQKHNLFSGFSKFELSPIKPTTKNMNTIQAEGIVKSTVNAMTILNADNNNNNNNNNNKKYHHIVSNNNINKNHFKIGPIQRSKLMNIICSTSSKHKFISSDLEDNITSNENSENEHEILNPTEILSNTHPNDSIEMSTTNNIVMIEKADPKIYKTNNSDFF